MADVILDQLETGEIDHYYGSKWQSSTLVEGGFEAEEYFPHLGDGGSWLYFTAAPIKASDGTIIGAIETLWDTTEKKRAETERQKYTRHIEASERALSQIVRGSAIPTFVLDRNHVITHWNQALEKLTGCPAARMVGTRRQWEPFWEAERASLADVIIDAPSEDEFQKLYGDRWRKSSLVEDAYEAEVFFPKLGNGGRTDQDCRRCGDRCHRNPAGHDGKETCRGRKPSSSQRVGGERAGSFTDHSRQHHAHLRHQSEPYCDPLEPGTGKAYRLFHRRDGGYQPSLETISKDSTAFDGGRHFGPAGNG